MNGRGVCKIALALLAGAAMAVGSPTLAGNHGGGGGMRGGGGGGMHGGGFQGHDGFHHDGFHHDGFHHDGFHHGHVAFVVGVGWPGWWGYPYYGGWPYPVSYPASYYAPPAQYIEQGDGSSDANAWWYRCDQPSGYYPYIKDCPGGWQTVPAQPMP